MFSKAAQITLLVKDQQEAKTFYTEKLGFEVSAEIAFSPTWSYLTVAPSSGNETALELLTAETPEQLALVGKQAGDQVLIMFTTDNIDKTYTELLGRGVIFHGEPQQVPGGRGVGFQDLYGNQLDLYQPDSAEPTIKPLSMADELLRELLQEAESTRRMLERIPESKLSWSPHKKSMTLGQLALHIAFIPGNLAELLDEPIHETPVVPLPEASSVKEILEEHERSVQAAQHRLAAWNDAALKAPWSMTFEGEAIMTVPRMEMVRSTMLNHWYHHRGQLSVYLRLLDIPLPDIYGPTADQA